MDYIIIRLKSNIEDTRVFGGSEIDSDHQLVECKFLILDTWKTQLQEKGHNIIHKTLSIQSTSVGKKNQ